MTHAVKAVILALIVSLVVGAGRSWYPIFLSLMAVGAMMPRQTFALTDSQLDIVLNTARDLPPEKRNVFLERVVAVLARSPLR